MRLQPNDPPAPTLALVAAVALHEAASLHAHCIEIKWPNDLVVIPPRHGEGLPGVDGPRLSTAVPGARRPDNHAKHGGGVSAKLAGILLERHGDAVVIGFGVNLAHHPDLPDRPATSLAALAGAAPEPARFAETLAEIFARWLLRWRGEGVAPVRQAWLAAAHPAGTALATSEGEGLFEGLDESGALKLRLADGTQRIIHAGDVFLI